MSVEGKCQLSILISTRACRFELWNRNVYEINGINLIRVQFSNYEYTCVEESEWSLNVYPKPTNRAGKKGS